MPTIYLNNFRGFKETYLTLKEINFFVGENSTGKTSILKLIKLLSDHRFWFNFDFNIEDAELGYFSEIVCKQNKEKFFEIGILGDERDKLKAISAIKLTFKNNEGQVELQNLRFIREKYEIEINLANKNYQYRFQKIDLKNVIESNKMKYYKFWLLNNPLSNKTYNNIKTPPNIPNNVLFFNLLSFIEKEQKILDFGFQLPSFLEDVVCVAPIRTEPKRTYDSYKIKYSSDGSHIPYILKQLLTKNKNKEKINHILNKFGEDSGLWDKIEINQLGSDSTSPFELIIFIKGIPFKINNVGYGVSQILPLVVEILARGNHNWFAIQQPEIHLHPRSQAAFGEFIYKTYVTEQKKFIIETHSDFLIDRLRIRFNLDNEIKKDIAQVVYFEKKEGNNVLSCIQINSDGTYSDEQPASFKEFFLKEQLSLLNL